MNTNFLYGVEEEEKKKKSSTLCLFWMTAVILNEQKAVVDITSRKYWDECLSFWGLINIQVWAQKSAGVIFHMAHAHMTGVAENRITQTVTNSIKSLISNKLA